MTATAEDYKKAFEGMWRSRNEISERYDQAVKAALDAQVERDRAIAEADKMRRERNQARREAEKMHYKYCDLYGWGWDEPVFSWQKEEKGDAKD